jgi:hypothetical protein
MSLAGLLLTVVLAVEGQVGPDPDFDPFALTVSDYAVADRGGVTDWAMVTLAASTVLLVFALPGIGRPARWLLGLFAAGMLVAAAAPTDEALDLSTTGQVHRYASVTAFVVLPAVGLLVARRAAPLLGWAVPAVRRLATAAVVFMAAMLVSQVFAGRALIGLAERLLLVTGVALLAVLAARAYQLGRPAYGHRRACPPDPRTAVVHGRR